MEADDAEAGLSPGSLDRLLPVLYGRPYTLLDHLAENGLLFLSDPAACRESLAAAGTLFAEEAAEPAHRLAFFAGSCAKCPIVPCPRGAKKKCPRPEFLRPSLEAYGFDVAGIIREFFGKELEWTAKEKPPQTLRLLAAIAELPRVS